MKKLFEISLLFFLSVSLCSCPYSSAYNLDQTPTIYVEDALLGKWTALIKKPGSNHEDLIYVKLDKKTDTEYNISFSGNLDELRPYNRVTSDSLTGTAFMSTINENQFLNIRINSRIYIAQLVMKGNKLSLLPLAEHFTAKMIFNSQALRNCVDIHYKTREHPTLDDEFCLRDMVKVQ